MYIDFQYLDRFKSYDREAFTILRDILMFDSPILHLGKVLDLLGLSSGCVKINANDLQFLSFPNIDEKKQLASSLSHSPDSQLHEDALALYL